MSEEVPSIAREVKTLQPGLKELLKSRDPWDREVEFQRRNLQKQYLHLILIHPYAKESKDAETHLWMQTSYALISIYKQRISNLERALREPSGQKQQARGQRHGPVEHRKLLQRFKQFLANEEKFWIQLVVRFQRQFGLTEAKAALTSLNILSSAETTPDENDIGDLETLQPEGVRQSHFRFPAEVHDLEPPPTQAEHAACLSTLSKALVCLGDLARYREQYNEGGSRPRPDEGMRRGGRNRRPILAEAARAKTYDKARACYERARDLVPNEGNASHQLAILASYQKDTFESLVHYYKALCVRASYDPAAENMSNVLTKFLDSWRRKRGKAKESVDSRNGPPAQSRTATFKEDMVLLHALWKLTPDRMDSIAPHHDERLLKEFSALVSDRALPIDTITKVIILTQGALWAHHMVRTPATLPAKHGSNSGPGTGAATTRTLDHIKESRIAGHLLASHIVLMNIAIMEMDEASKIVEEDLAMRITATFRRTLPALRLAGKWVRANLDYILRDTESQSALGIEKGTTKEYRETVKDFWAAYTAFARRLVTLFPPEKLPKLSRPLEEDAEAAGFLPLDGAIRPDGKLEDIDDQSMEIADVAEPGIVDARVLEQVHPNVEQLMRIWDIWHDAKILFDTKRTPIELPAELPLEAPVGPGNRVEVEAHSRSSESAANPWPSSSVWGAVRGGTAVEEDARTEVTKTDDDPVGDAFRQVLSVSSEEEEQDEIVWDPRAHAPQTPPIVSPMLAHRIPLPSSNHASPPTATKSHPGFNYPSPTRPADTLSPALQPRNYSPPANKTTAQDLLNNVMGMGRPSNIGDSRPGPHSHSAYAQQLPSHGPAQQGLPSSHSKLLFGGPQAAFGAGPSIWATSPDESSLGMHQRHPSNSLPHSSPSFATQTFSQTLPQGPWSPPFGHSSQMSQNGVMNALPTMPPSAPFFRAVGDNGHRRVPSSSFPAYDAHVNPGYQDSVVYTSSPLQPPPIGAPVHNTIGHMHSPGSIPLALQASVWAGNSGHPSDPPALYPGGGYAPHHTHGSFDGQKYGDLPQQRIGGIWGDAG